LRYQCLFADVGITHRCFWTAKTNHPPTRCSWTNRASFDTSISSRSCLYYRNAIYYRVNTYARFSDLWILRTTHSRRDDFLIETSSETNDGERQVCETGETRRSIGADEIVAALDARAQHTRTWARNILSHTSR